MIYISENIGGPSEEKKKQVQKTMEKIRSLRNKRVTHGGPDGEEENKRRDGEADDLSRGLRDLGRENKD